ncbi:prepilin-type N-terminal cleavage/methylation domain-containing protein [Candidatus Sumerlaeota bacterium]|nr:prepilin-type N-terminal cleavage/methylation domain-containing protein [Candidatus Sumerlaeota bacterium]
MRTGSKRGRGSGRAGFTLIELMVVVGILLVVSGMAVSNIQVAQTRARVSRVMVDLRTIAGAIEQYRVDLNQVPRMAHYRFYEDPEIDVVLGESVNGILSRVLSTPVGYINNTLILDPFMATMNGARVDERLYTYQDLSTYSRRNPESSFWPRAKIELGSWRLGSVGPDRTFDHGFRNSAQLPYDPTNGTISLGNIWCTERGGFDTGFLMQSDLLGPHS